MLGVCRSGFHAWERRPRSDRALADAWLVERIREVDADSRPPAGPAASSARSGIAASASAANVSSG
jgi:hypothetical protein